MIFDNKYLEKHRFDTMPKTLVKIKTENGHSYNEVTKKREITYTTENVYAYIGRFSESIINRESNNLTQESRKVILPYETTVNSDCIIVIDGDDYRVTYISRWRNFPVIGVNKK